ncbi:hypothetical protein [Actinomyces sp. zg328]|uniref:hypothetical protein n=1 Tax=Actinomyces sp. zg328 TaxID=2609287 RepID=UPI00135CCAFE|nr:hypothetical protein [Actinomyces sp. zg328]
MTSATSAATVTSHANGATRPTTAPRIAHHPKLCGSNIATAIHCKKSADKHRIPHPDIEHAIFHPINKHQIEGRRGDVTYVFVGKRHELSRSILEVMVALRLSGHLEISHAMEVTDKWRWLLYTPGRTDWEE